MYGILFAIRGRILSDEGDDYPNKVYWVQTPHKTVTLENVFLNYVFITKLTWPRPKKTSLSKHVRSVCQKIIVHFDPMQIDQLSFKHKETYRES